MKGMFVYNIQNVAQDKGGPSKGGILTNTLCSYTDLYVRNEINVVYLNKL